MKLLPVRVASDRAVIVAATKFLGQRELVAGAGNLSEKVDRGETLDELLIVRLFKERSRNGHRKGFVAELKIVEGDHAAPHQLSVSLKSSAASCPIFSEPASRIRIRQLLLPDPQEQEVNVVNASAIYD